MTTFPLATLGPTINASGISIPSYSDIFSSLQATYQSIYGSDAIITSDSQDGQWIAAIAKAINDVNQTIVAVYNGYSPSSATGAALSNLVKNNGIRRLVPTNSSATVTIVGIPGTTINGGLITDDLGLGTEWSIPDGTLIPPAGQLDALATSTSAGAVTAAAGTLTVIATPVLGWQSVNNAVAATVGAPVETDAALRQRQSVSTALPSITPREAIQAAVANVSGVQDSTVYENALSGPDANGIPGHSIAVVANGGDPVAIANAIASKKAPGVGTFGTTSEVVVDSLGVASTINFFELATTRIFVNITIKAGAGFASSTETAITSSLAAYVNALAIGGKVPYNKLSVPANLEGKFAQQATGFTQDQLETLSATYDVVSLTVGISAAPAGQVDVPVAFNSQASLAVGDITLVVT